MTNKKNIDRQIYHLSPNISKHLLPLYGGYICSAVGVPAALIYLSVDLSQRQILSELIAVLMTFGGISLLLVVCFYLFGDCKRPFYRPERELLEREEIFYDNSERETIIKYVKNGNLKALEEMHTSIQAQIIVVSYRDKAQRITAIQAFENDADRLTPITDIFFNEKND